PQLEQANVTDATREVVLEAVDQGVQQRATQPALVRGERQEQRDVTLLLPDEGHTAGLEEALRDEQRAQSVLEAADRMVLERTDPERPELYGELVVAVTAGHLLDEIVLAHDIVAAEAGHAHRDALCVPCFRSEGHTAGLEEALRDEQRAQSVLEAADRMVLERTDPERPELYGELVVAVTAGHLLDEIVLAHDIVAAEAGHAHRDALCVPCVDVEADRCEQLGQLRRRERHAEHLLHA